MKTHNGAACESFSLRTEDLPENNACALCREGSDVRRYILGVGVDGAIDNRAALRNAIRASAEMGWAKGVTYALVEMGQGRRTDIDLCGSHLQLLRSFLAARQTDMRVELTKAPAKPAKRTH